MAQKQLDSISLEQQAKYKTAGLTVTSNDTTIIPRDSAGNIVLTENQQNPLLIIEPVATKITTDSALKVLDTRFNYYKFPPTIIERRVSEVNLDTELTFDVDDTVFARYRPDEAFRIPLQAGDWNQAAKFNIISNFDFVEDGVSQKIPGHYFITSELKQSGVNLRIRLQIEHRYDTWYANEFGTCFFSIVKNSPTTGVNTLFRGPFANKSRSTVTGNPTLTPGPAANTVWGSIGQWEVQVLKEDFIIRNNEFEAGDYLVLGAFAGQNNDGANHTINAIQSFWVITDASKKVNEWNQQKK